MIYVTKEAVKAEFEKYGSTEDFNAIIDLIPPADVAPVRRGKWIHEKIESAESSIGFFLSATCECSLCHTFVQQESNYCPSCGAKMEVGE